MAWQYFNIWMPGKWEASGKLYLGGGGYLVTGGQKFFYEGQPNRREALVTCQTLFQKMVVVDAGY